MIISFETRTLLFDQKIENYLHIPQKYVDGFVRFS